MEIKDIIKQKRIEKGLSMEELAKLVGVSHATISRWESGNIATMKQTKIKLLATALDISPAVLIENTTVQQNSIGERIKELRIEKGCTQEEISKLLGVAKQTYFKYENDIITNIPLNKIELLANFFNVSEAYIIGWNSNQGKTPCDYTSIENKPQIKKLVELCDNLSPAHLETLIELVKMLQPQNKKGV